MNSPTVNDTVLTPLNAAERIRTALNALPGQAALSSSFGAQSAVMLHLTTQIAPDLPIILIDTGYLFPETYQFVDELTARLNLNLQVFQPKLSSAWLETRHGRLWEQGLDGLNVYNKQMKVEPMRRALRELNVGLWLSGLRRQQSAGRATTPLLTQSGERYKLHPIADWTDRDVFNYLQRHDLPYHPLWSEGYISIGDTHTTRRLQDVDNPEETRFFGLKRECGLHEIALGQL